MNHQFNQCWHKVKNNSLLVCFNFSYQWNIIAVYQFPPTLLLCLLNECCINHIIMIFTGEKNMCCKKPKHYLWSTFLIRIWSPPNYCDYRIIFCPLEMDIFGLNEWQFSKMLMPKTTWYWRPSTRLIFLISDHRPLFC